MDYGALVRPDSVAPLAVCAFLMAEASRALVSSRWGAALIGGLAGGVALGLAIDVTGWAWMVLPAGCAACSLSIEAVRRLAVWLLRRSGRSVGSTRSSALLVPAWSGRLPLWRTGYQVVVTTAALAFVGLSVQAAPLHRHTRLVAAAVPLTWLVAGLAGVWAVVGVWRSSRAHVRGGGRRSWAWIARLTVLLLAGIVLLLSGGEGSRAVAYGKLAASPPQRDRYSLRLLRAGTEVEISGELGFGVGQDLAALLQKNAGVRVLHLDSPGGWVFEGQRLARLVRERKLVTYVAHRCESACVRVFAAGEDRWISRRAMFGLHAPGGELSTPRSRRASDAEERNYLVARGIAAAFVDRGLATPTDEMWRPTREEVIASHLATRYAGPDEVALSGGPPEKLDRLDLYLREDLLFQTLFEFERPLFDRVVTQLRIGYELGQSEAEALGFLEQEVASLAERDLPRTSDSAAVQFVRSIDAVARQLQRSNPRACAALLSGETATSAVGTALAQVRAPVTEAMARVMIDAHNKPQAVPRFEDVRWDVAAAVASAEKRDPGAAELLDDGGAPGREPERYCNGVLAVLQGVLDLEPDAAGRVYRYLSAQTAATANAGPASATRRGRESRPQPSP